LKYNGFFLFPDDLPLAGAADRYGCGKKALALLYGFLFSQRAKRVLFALYVILTNDLTLNPFCSPPSGFHLWDSLWDTHKSQYITS
jgi:hypothetical protein